MKFFSDEILPVGLITSGGKVKIGCSSVSKKSKEQKKLLSNMPYSVSRKIDRSWNDSKIQTIKYLLRATS